MTINRRMFLKAAGAGAVAGAMPISLVKASFGAKNTAEDFTFGYISDAHIQQIEGDKFVRNWDMGLIRAVREANLLQPRPDFFFFGGDLAQLGKKEELDHGLEILSALRGQVRYVIGEHDYYLDLGKYWQEKIGPLFYSFDHKGVHFIVLNSILTHDDWTLKKWSTPMDRMLAMARLDNPDGSPFLVGDAQRDWLKKDLEKVSKDTPIVICSHSPIQQIFQDWNFWTDDAEGVQALLKPFKKVTVIYGHVHQIQYNQIGNISFHAVMATAWPWPYPQSYTQKPSRLPQLTVPMNRADPFFERDATGWQFIDVRTGNIDVSYQLPDNKNRKVAFNSKAGAPQDVERQEPGSRIPPQNHF
jgi:3',5'-cyclic AMP phosphodiesterase CpdA